jgi:hypothetical protein
MKTNTTMSTVADAMDDLQINSMLRLLITVVDQSRDFNDKEIQVTNSILGFPCFTGGKMDVEGKQL